VYWTKCRCHSIDFCRCFFNFCLFHRGEPTTLAEAQAMVKFADSDKDGVVSKAEFFDIFEKLQ
jgi:Ca2+-binding EF-hand superfamily protein